MSQLQNVISNVAGFKEALFGTLSATEVSFVSLLCNVHLSRLEITKYCNPLRDIGPAYEIAEGVKQHGYKVVLVGTDVSHLVERVRYPVKSWKTGQVYYPLVLWGAVVPMDDSFDVDRYFDVCHYFEEHCGTRIRSAVGHKPNYSTQLTFNTLHECDGVTLITHMPSVPYTYRLTIAAPTLGSIAGLRSPIHTEGHNVGGVDTSDGEGRGGVFAVSSTVGPETYEASFLNFRDEYLLGQLVGILRNNDLFTRIMDSQSPVPGWTCAIVDVRDPTIVDDLRHSTMTPRVGGEIFEGYVSIFIPETVDLNFYITKVAASELTPGMHLYSVPGASNTVEVL